MGEASTEKKEQSLKSLRHCEWALCGRKQGGSIPSIHISPCGSITSISLRGNYHYGGRDHQGSRAGQVPRNTVGFKAYFHAL